MDREGRRRRPTAGAYEEAYRCLSHPHEKRQLLLFEIETGEVEPQGITRRQAQVALLVSLGCTNEQIAEEFGISLSAAKKQVSILLRKFCCRDRWELGALVYRLIERGRTPPGAITRIAR